MCIMGIDNISGGALNPARAYGPQLGAILINMNMKMIAANNWIYVAPFLGAIIAAFMYNFLFMGDEKDDLVEVEVDLELKM